MQAVGDAVRAALRAQHQVRVPNEEVAVAARGHRHQLQPLDTPHLQPALLPGLGERRWVPLRSHGWQRRSGRGPAPPVYSAGRAGGARRGRPGRLRRDAPVPPLPAAPGAGLAAFSYWFLTRLQNKLTRNPLCVCAQRRSKGVIKKKKKPPSLQTKNVSLF